MYLLRGEKQKKTTTADAVFEKQEKLRRFFQKFYFSTYCQIKLHMLRLLI